MFTNIISKLTVTGNFPVLFGDLFILCQFLPYIRIFLTPKIGAMQHYKLTHSMSDGSNFYIFFKQSNVIYNLLWLYCEFSLASSEVHSSVDVPLATQYCLTAISIFSGTKGPSSWSIIFVSHRMPLAILLTLFKASTSSRKMTVPSGRKIRSISKRISSNSHLSTTCSTT